jgi:hypothetical protein
LFQSCTKREPGEQFPDLTNKVAYAGCQEQEGSLFVPDGVVGLYEGQQSACMFRTRAIIQSASVLVQDIVGGMYRTNRDRRPTIPLEQQVSQPTRDAETYRYNALTRPNRPQTGQELLVLVHPLQSIRQSCSIAFAQSGGADSSSSSRRHIQPRRAVGPA